MPAVLWWPDLILAVIGLCILAGAAARWWPARRDPLRGSPLRPHAMAPVHIWLCLVANLASWSLASQIAKRISPPGLDQEHLDAWHGVLASAISSVLIFLACSTIVAYTFRSGWHGFVFGKRSVRSELIYGIAAALVAIGLTESVSWLTGRLIPLLLPHFKPTEHVVFQMMDAPNTSPAMRTLILVGAFVLAPIAEEMFFRGILQTGLLKILPARWHSMRHRWLAILITACIFGGVHPTPQHVPALIVLGVLLGFVYERRGALITPIIVHMLFNGKSLLWREIERRLSGM